MSDTTTGLKAGAVAGIVYGIIDAIVAVILFTVFKTTIMDSIQKSVNNLNTNVVPNIQTIYSLLIVVEAVAAIIGGVILGLILGAIFGYVHRRLPGKSQPLKGVFFGFVLWVILNLLIGYSSFTYGLDFYVVSVIGGLVAAIVFGLLTGFLFDKWKESPHVESNSWTEQ